MIIIKNLKLFRIFKKLEQFKIRIIKTLMNIN